MVKEETTTKKTVKKAEIKKAEAVVLTGEYVYALGRRKTSVAQVRVHAKHKGEQVILVNGKKLDEYFTIDRLRDAVKAPLIALGKEELSVSVKVVGGGIMGQAEAAKLGIARALVKMDEANKPVLRGAGFMTRDARVVERKKPGFKKARKSPQWAKR
jgi:small subunit ribosomal protein S9